ncbi:LysM peptidoglycan-binding domain-containing C40 family peptidase [Arthrobacter sp. SF27]|nr:LysM peptidoglycan-binding domain-containing C40 family peptidase [Arthrobacter sp. SF27]
MSRENNTNTRAKLRRIIRQDYYGTAPPPERIHRASTSTKPPPKPPLTARPFCGVTNPLCRVATTSALPGPAPSEWLCLTLPPFRVRSLDRWQRRGTHVYRAPSRALGVKPHFTTERFSEVERGRVTPIRTRQLTSQALGEATTLFKNTSARHRATPVHSNPFSGVSKAVSSHAGTVGRSAAVVTAAGGLMLGAGLPANAASDVSSSDFAATAQAEAVAAPAAAPAPAPASSEDAATHTVKAGDTLGNIAAQHGVELNDVFAANGLGFASVIYPGDVIQLSGAAQAPAAQAAPAAPAPAEAPATQAAPQEEAFTVAAASANIELASTSTASTSGIVGTAKSMVGTPYVWGGTSTSGWDCSGFVQWVYAQHGIDLPRVTTAQAGALTPTSNPKPGDLVLQNGGSHIGIYLGGGQMISALNPGEGTKVHPTSWMPVDGYFTA